MIKNRFGEWGKHMQEITTYKGDRFVGFTEVIDDFVERGNRERLLVRLALFLHENQAGDDEISGLLAPLINYRDESSPDMARSGRADEIEEDNKLRRLSLLQETIRHIIPPGSGEPVEGGEPLQQESSTVTE